MPDKVPEDVVELLDQHGQSHLCGWWNDCTHPERESLIAQIRQIDFDLIGRLVAEHVKSGKTKADDRGERAESPKRLERLARTPDEKAAQVSAHARGLEALSKGKVAAMVVAGGQGSRLGFDQPKGMFPIGPLTGKTLFQLHFEQLEALTTQAGRRIPYLIMTSEATDAETKAYLEENDYFGASLHDVYIFKQGWLPAVDPDGKILMADKSTVAASPDGHGGMLKALKRAGLLDILTDQGIEHVYYHQVDNPTAILCDPTLIGLHEKHRSEMTTKVVAKASAEEKMGVVVDVDGRTQIIEYSDLSPEQQAATDEDGELKLWAGNTAIHVFSRPFLERVTAEGADLPYHLAHKKVGYFDQDSGHVVTPEEPNAYKFEQFIFDALPEAENALVVEADRAREFNPVKNAEGGDSPATAQAALNRIAAEWVAEAGGRVNEGVTVEISPLYARDEETLASKVSPGTIFKEDTALEPEEEGS